MGKVRPGRFRLLLAAGFNLLFFSSPALAHTPVRGMGEVVNGALHPVTSPAHLLVLLGLALFGAQRSSRRALTPLLCFAATLAVALPLTMTMPRVSVPPPLLAGVALIVSAIVALRLPLPLPVAGAIHGVAALVIGLDSTAEGGSPDVILKTLLGTWLGASFFLGSGMFYLSQIPRKQWAKIGLRVLASWIIAISLLMLAFSLRNPATSQKRAVASTGHDQSPSSSSTGFTMRARTHGSLRKTFPPPRA